MNNFELNSSARKRCEIQKDNKSTHFTLGTDAGDQSRQLVPSMSDPSHGVVQVSNRHIKMANESKKTHFKLSPDGKNHQDSLLTTQRQAYKLANKSEIIQPTINSLDFKKTHFKLGFQKPSFETSNIKVSTSK
jgi:hypothetical protein